MCFEFSVQNALLSGALKVEYLENYPRFDITGGSADDILKEFLAKALAWEYEQEFRLVATEEPWLYDDVPSTKHGLLPPPDRSPPVNHCGCRNADC